MDVSHPQCLDRFECKNFAHLGHTYEHLWLAIILAVSLFAKNTADVNLQSVKPASYRTGTNRLNGLLTPLRNELKLR